MNRQLETYEIYCDGACRGNGGSKRLGGWAYAIYFDSQLIRKDSGAIPDTTNQRMELTATLEAIKGLLAITKDKPGLICNFYSDSAYVINCYTQGWYKSWVANGWRNSAKKDVANVDLWQQLIPFFERNDFHFYKVAGHSGLHENELVDGMAVAATKEYEKSGRAYGGKPIWECEDLKING